jgi:hypothetical protein
MIWLTWRQHRATVATATALLGVVAMFLFVEGRTVHSVFQSSGLSACLAAHGSCSEPARAFTNRFSGLQFVVPLLLAAPLLVGLFFGSPLVARELEHGTHRLVWTQGITRRRWTLTKLGLLAAAALVLAAAFAAVTSWFATPFDKASTRLSPGVFDLQGVVPVAYTLFAVALGAALGAVLRRTVPAMAATLAAFVGVRAVVVLLARPHFLPTRTISYPTIAPAPSSTDADWVVRSQIVDAHGTVVGDGHGLELSPERLAAWCPSLPATPDQLPDRSAVDACLNSIGLRTIDTYHPASQYWAFQGIEAALFVLAAAALAVLTMWWVRRRVV